MGLPPHTPSQQSRPTERPRGSSVSISSEVTKTANAMAEEPLRQLPTVTAHLNPMTSESHSSLLLT